MNQPLVSVLIAAYNAEKFIVDSVTSICNQTFKNIEIIICNDCSTDNTYQLLIELQKKDERIILLNNESNLFASSTRNKCLEIARGEYVAIQDADDISHPKRIEILLNFLLANPTFDFVSSSEALFDSNISDPYRIVDHKKHPTKRSFLRGMCFCHAGTMFRKKCLLKVGGYPRIKKIKRHEDYLLFMFLYASRFRGANIDDCLYFYRVDNETLRRRTFISCIEEIKIRIIGFSKMHILLIGLPFLLIPFFSYIKNRFRRVLN